MQKYVRCLCCVPCLFFKALLPLRLSSGSSLLGVPLRFLFLALGLGFAL